MDLQIDTINWLITGHCPLDCTYCYAEDAMRGRVKRRSFQDSTQTIKWLEEVSPFTVVLSGGEPLLHPEWREFASQLSLNHQVIVDTSGTILLRGPFDPSIFKFRISIDSHIESINQVSRPSRSGVEFHRKILNSIEVANHSDCLECVQTVVTNINLNLLEDLGSYLQSLGVQKWRLQRQITPNRVARKKSFNSVCEQFELDARIKHFLSSQSVFHGKIVFTGINEHQPNSVLLILPNGHVVVDNLSTFKTLIDQRNPCFPGINQVYKSLNKVGHISRYNA